MNAYEAFEKYMLEVFERPYDPEDLTDITKRNIFVAGWEAGWNQYHEEMLKRLKHARK